MLVNEKQRSILHEEYDVVCVLLQTAKFYF